ncbi:hypothetical protein [Pseudophaeobacter sp.]|uniref:hypothetical protein n=1 Tax=Pseudophaeobacter sp. TaxID=1971739 RepID=UPI0032974B8E
MNLRDLDHAEITRIANEIASYSSMADAYQKSGNDLHHRGASAACLSGFLQLASEMNQEVQEVAQ